jgi:hypothetical protein
MTKIRHRRSNCKSLKTACTWHSMRYQTAVLIGYNYVREPHLKRSSKGASIMLAAIIAVSWYIVSTVMVTDANVCAVEHFELGRCEGLLNGLGVHGWKFIGASPQLCHNSSFRRTLHA